MSEITDIIVRWVERADHDLGTAIVTHRYIPKYKDTIAFHCQQAVEKYLKSYMLKLGLQVKKTHDLVFLLEQIDKIDKVEYELFEKVFELQDYAVEIRYPDQVIELTDNNIIAAIDIASQFRTLILRKLGLNISFDDINIKP